MALRLFYQIQIWIYHIVIIPLGVLRRHEIVKKEGELVTLYVNKLTFEQKVQIKMICEKKLQEIIVKRGLGVWDYRLLGSSTVPDSLYCNVLKESHGRCALCGATKNERPLHVDLIKPRSMGGKTEYDNLQVLCSKCNQAKRNNLKSILIFHVYQLMMVGLMIWFLQRNILFPYEMNVFSVREYFIGGKKN